MTLTKPSLDLIRRLIPPLSYELHKGQSGRVCVIGGSEDYTGAPYFSAFSALKLGADMAHIVCQPTAAISIKSNSLCFHYVIDLMVHPYMRISENTPDLIPKEIIDNVTSLFKRLNVLVIGPGLSRDKMMLECAKGIILKAKEQNIPLIIDADGLFLIQNYPDLVKNYSEAILTPNVNEFRRLCETMGIEFEDDHEKLTKNLSRAFGGVTIVRKGKNDIISNGNSTFLVDNKGGLKRCGGQGDILTGLISTFIAWGVAYKKNIWEHDNSITSSDIPMLASFAGCTLMRECSWAAFEKFGRSVQTSDMIPEIGPSFQRLFK
ncbi:19179_t:CDS:10, partial [Cetraspora pellucida]